MCYHGIRFDNVAIVYSNLLFILMSIIPWRITTSGVYQKILYWIFLIFNSFFLSFNFIDFAYYRFNNNRLMSNFLEVIEFETNKATLFFHFVEVYYYLFILFFAVIFLLGWVKAFPWRESVGPCRLQPISVSRGSKSVAREWMPPECWPP